MLPLSRRPVQISSTTSHFVSDFRPRSNIQSFPSVSVKSIASYRLGAALMSNSRFGLTTVTSSATQVSPSIMHCLERTLTRGFGGRSGATSKGLRFIGVMVGIQYAPTDGSHHVVL